VSPRVLRVGNVVRVSRISPPPARADNPPPGSTMHVPPPFDLDLVVRSHGWYDLPPFEWDSDAHRLGFVFLEGECPVQVRVRSAATGLVATATAVPPSLPFKEEPSSNIPSRSAARRVLERVLDLRAELSTFHSSCAADPRFAWIARRGAGRILRAPTLFEDAVKVLATTNCTWGLTKVMVKNLIARYGRGGAFPPAAFVAALGAREIEKLKFGYRAPYLALFAERVASGALDLARWEDASRATEDVEKEIRTEKGFGPYAADTLGRLLGRHGRLGLDSWSRKKVSVLRFRGRKVSDARVARFYAPFGDHAGLAFWLDVTRDWHFETERLWP
jgi:3-methyladenine DNA glycosylase/8-oxoguanine DNA glycosylase